MSLNCIYDTTDTQNLPQSAALRLVEALGGCCVHTLLMEASCRPCSDFLLKYSLDTEGKRKPFLIFGKNVYCSLFSFITHCCKGLERCGILKKNEKKSSCSKYTIHFLQESQTINISDIFISLYTVLNYCRNDISAYMSVYCLMKSSSVVASISLTYVWEMSA